MEGPSTTAGLCSFARAHHSLNGNHAIFDDYLAFDMLGETTYRELESLVAFEACSCGVAPRDGDVVCPWLNEHLCPLLLSRAAFAERALQVFAERHAECQYVICGAGMDTFSFRNGNPGIRVFELDHPITQAWKTERVGSLGWRARGDVRFVPIDFAEGGLGSALLEAGFDSQMPAFFSVLGVLYYISLAEFERTVAGIASVSCPGSELVFDYPHRAANHFDAGASGVLQRLAANVGEPMHGGYSPREVEDVLARNGMQVEVHLAPERVQALFFEGRLDGQRAAGNVHLVKASVTERGLA